MWPEMVYPSTLPGNVPFAMNVKMADLYASSHDDTGRTITHNDFQFPQEANLFAAGTLGDHFSFRGEVTYAENPDGSSGVEIEHVRLDVISPFGPEHLFNFRIGKLAPNLYDGFQEMWLMTDNGVDTLFTYNPIGWSGGTGLAEEGGGIGLPARARAIEMYGVAAHRLFYTIGVAAPIGPGGPNGLFNNNSTKDVYARLDYKFGGLGLDGDSTGVTLPPENWRETSFRIGVFGYRGDGNGVDYEITDPDGNPFKMQQRRLHASRRLTARSTWRPEPLRRRRPRHRRPVAPGRRDGRRDLPEPRGRGTPGSPRPTTSSRPSSSSRSGTRTSGRRTAPSTRSGFSTRTSAFWRGPTSS